MTIDFLDERRRALENSFYQRENERLLQRIRNQHEHQLQRAALAKACGIDDSQLLDALLSQGVTAESLPALLMVPLVAVAWANGDVKVEEREAIREAARCCGVDRDCAACALLDHWLEVSPAPRLLEVWVEYAGELAARMGPDDRVRFANEILERCHRVARAEGGVLGVVGPKISRAEREILETVEGAFATHRENGASS